MDLRLQLTLIAIHPDPGEVLGGQPGGERAGAADPLQQEVGGSVVAVHHHGLQQLSHRVLAPARPRRGDGRVLRGELVVDQKDPLTRQDLAGVDLTQHGRRQRQLEDALHRKAALAVEQIALAAFQVHQAYAQKTRLCDDGEGLDGGVQTLEIDLRRGRGGLRHLGFARGQQERGRHRKQRPAVEGCHSVSGLL